MLENSVPLYEIKDEIWPSFRAAGDLAESQKTGWQISQIGMGDTVELFRIESDNSVTGPFKCPKNGYSKMPPSLPIPWIVVIDFKTRRFRISVPPGASDLAIQTLVDAAAIKLIKEKPYKWHIEK